MSKIPCAAAFVLACIATPAAAADRLTAGDAVRIEERTEGDLAAAGRSVVLGAPVGGYVLAAGADVAIGERVGNDVWAAGRDVRIDGEVADDVHLAGASVHVGAGARVGGDAYLSGGRVEVRGPVGGDLRLRAAEARLAAPVDGSVTVTADRVELERGALIRGDLEVSGPRPPDIAPEARVLGRVSHRVPSDDGALAARVVAGSLAFVATFVLGSAMLRFAPRWTARVVDAQRRPFASTLVGIVALVVVPVLVVLAGATVVGLPLAGVMAALYVLALLMSGPIVSLAVGRWFRRQRERAGRSPYLRLAAGALLLSVLGTLPWVGPVVWLVVAALGLGGWVLERRRALRDS